MVKFLVYTIVSFISTFGIAYLYYKISNAIFKFNLKILVVFIVGVILFSFVKYFNIMFLSLVLYFLYFPILFCLIKYSSFEELLFYLIVIWIYGIVLDVFSMLIMILFEKVIDFDVYNYTYRILLSSFVFIMFMVSSHNLRFKNLLGTMYKMVHKINCFNFLLIVYVIFSLFMSVDIFLNLKNINISILLMAVLLLLSLSFILLLSVKIYLIESDKFLELLKKNNDFYLKIEDENRIFKHNLMAKLLAIKSVSGKKARELIDDYILSFNNSMDFSVKIKDMPYGLNGVIYEKLYPSIGSLDIKIDNKINFDIFQKIKPRRYNVFVEKLIIALDNAIEASLTSVDKILVINLYSEDGNIIADIKNSFTTDLNLDKLGSIHYSTKDKKKRGLGLFSALRDNEVNMKIKIINNLFVTKIVAKQNINE